jgi:hypothetical protein
MGDKFVALVGSGWQTCHPSRAEKGLKDWAISLRLWGLGPEVVLLFYEKNSSQFFWNQNQNNTSFKQRRHSRRKGTMIISVYLFTRNTIFVSCSVMRHHATARIDPNFGRNMNFQCACKQKAILNFTPGPQGWNLSSMGNVHPQGWTLSTVMNGGVKVCPYGRS